MKSSDFSVPLPTSFDTITESSDSMSKLMQLIRQNETYKRLLDSDYVKRWAITFEDTEFIIVDNEASDTFGFKWQKGIAIQDTDMQLVKDIDDVADKAKVEGAITADPDATEVTLGTSVDVSGDFTFARVKTGEDEVVHWVSYALSTKIDLQKFLNNQIQIYLLEVPANHIDTFKKYMHTNMNTIKHILATHATFFDNVGNNLVQGFAESVMLHSGVTELFLRATKNDASPAARTLAEKFQEMFSDDEHMYKCSLRSRGSALTRYEYLSLRSSYRPTKKAKAASRAATPACVFSKTNMFHVTMTNAQSELLLGKPNSMKK